MRQELDRNQQSSSHPRVPANGQSALSPSPKASRSANGSSNGTVATNGSSSFVQQQRPSQGPFYGHDREELARILIQGLQDLGYNQAAGALSEESGFDLETIPAAAFRRALIEGDWNEAESLLPAPRDSNDAHTNGHQSNGHGSQKSSGKLALAAEADVDLMIFHLRRQKYLELLEQDDRTAALAVLRLELQPLHQDERELHFLSSLIMCPSAADLKAQADWDGAAGQSRKILLTALSRCISPAAMIPEHRLAELLVQVQDYKVKSCLYHNKSEPLSLYTDHVCDPDDFPRTQVAELSKHSDEVWVLQFSHDGTRLATAGKEKQAIIWSMDTFQPIHILGSNGVNNSHRDSLTCVAWSPDDTKLVTCSKDKEARVWDTGNRRCLHTVKHHSEPVTSAAFTPDGKSFVTGALETEHSLAIWDAHELSDVPIYSFSHAGFRVTNCAVGSVKPPSWSLDAHAGRSSRRASSQSQEDPSSEQIILAVVTLEHNILIFDYNTRQRLHQVSMHDEITCVSLSSDGQDMLFNLSSSEVWSWNIEARKMSQKYLGHKQGQFVVRSCFGGATEGFVVSGGEDSSIQVWHRHSGRLLEQFPSHAGFKCCINAVAWNPARPLMWASACDDAKVRVYATTSRPHEQRLNSPLLSGPSGNSQSKIATSAPLPQWGAAGSSGGASGPVGERRGSARRIFGEARAVEDPELELER